MTPQHNEHFASYGQAVDWITSLQHFGIVPGLARMEELLRKLGNPERTLKFVHIAGTNGKGSTCAYLTRVLVHAGFGVGTFTSPNIEKFTNRIRFNEKDIPEEDLLTITNQLRPLVEEIASTELGQPTMFEVLTAMAIVFFAEVCPTDFVVWETGLGGRLDSTNVVTPIVSVITNIGHDHMGILGSTLEEIAAEKAGIIKREVPVVSAVEQPGVIEVIERTSHERRAPLYLLGRDFSFRARSILLNRQVFDFHGALLEGALQDVPNVTITLNGAHQLKNAAVALMTLEVMRHRYGFDISLDAVYAGMASTRWAGRMELVSDTPRIVLDGAHNPEGAEALASAITQLYSYDKLRLMIGMMASKRHTDHLKHLLPHADTLIVTEPDFEGKMDAESLFAVAKDVLGERIHDMDVVVEPDWKRALTLLTERTDPDDLAVITGTLYLIADVRSWILHGVVSEKGR